MPKEYIEREAVSEGIRKYYYKNPPHSSYQEGFDRGLDKAQRVILDAPAADVAPVRHGRWDGEGDGYADGEIVIDVWYCSECGYCIDDGTDDPNILPNYCPNCGALMDKEEL